MNKGILARKLGTILFIALTAALLSANATLAQANLRVTGASSSSISVAWDAVAGITEYTIYYRFPADSNSPIHAGSTSSTSHTVTGLRSNANYRIELIWIETVSQHRSMFHSESVQARTTGSSKRSSSSGSSSSGSESSEPDFQRAQAPQSNCIHLPSQVAVTGYANSTQCQMVGEVVIAKTDLLGRGFIDAVDVWSYVPNGVEVCFRNSGWLAFLDADYAPRAVMELESRQRDGMTCGTIDRAGTVVLLASAPQAAAPQPAENTVPLFEAVPLHDCQIKLVETLFLRASPGGEIIGLVWINSEVPVFEINGYWYRVEFEGKTGYVSRYFRKVLRGGCG